MSAPSDKELEAMQRRVQEIEEETTKLREMQAQIDIDMAAPVDGEKEEADRRSVHIGNVDYAVTAEQLQSHFQGCGAINRITILRDRYTGHPKGFAYVEFSEMSSVANASTLNDTVINGRAIKVTPKRTNIPGFGRVGARGRGRGGRGISMPHYVQPMYGMPAPVPSFAFGPYPFMARGGGYRGRGGYGRGARGGFVSYAPY